MGTARWGEVSRGAVQMLVNGLRQKCSDNNDDDDDDTRSTVFLWLPDMLTGSEARAAFPGPGAAIHATLVASHQSDDAVAPSKLQSPEGSAPLRNRILPTLMHPSASSHQSTSLEHTNGPAPRLHSLTLPLGRVVKYIQQQDIMACYPCHSHCNKASYHQTADMTPPPTRE